VTLFAEVVDWGAVLEVIWVSLLAGVGVTAIFSIGILAAARTGDLQKGGQGAPQPPTRCSHCLLLRQWPQRWCSASW